MKKILLIALGLVSPALGMVGVQAGSGGENVQNAKMEALQRRCEELSSNEIKYESVTGTVINAGFTPPLLVDTLHIHYPGHLDPNVNMLAKWHLVHL